MASDTYQPDGPEGLELLANFFEHILSKDPTYAHMFTEIGTVEEDMRRWANEMRSIQAFFPEWEVFAPGEPPAGHCQISRALGYDPHPIDTCGDPETWKVSSAAPSIA